MVINDVWGQVANGETIKQLPGREQFKHILFAPSLWNTYDAAYFPGVRDAIEEGEMSLAQSQVDKTAKILRDASLKLVGWDSDGK